MSIKLVELDKSNSAYVRMHSQKKKIPDVLQISAEISDKKKKKSNSNSTENAGYNSEKIREYYLTQD